MKILHFVGASREDLRQFSDEAREDAGFQLYKVQQGEEPDDWKPMPTVGAGVQEIRVRDERGAYRVLYVAKFEEAVYVLHAFEKRAQKTAGPDVHRAKTRYAEMLKWRKEQGL